jgi:hypothetical protein
LPARSWEARGCRSWGKLKFGLEICLDHGYGLLKETQGGDVHFQIILSAAVKGIEKFYAIKKGGFVIHASTNSWYSGVTQRGLQPFKEQEYNIFSGGYEEKQADYKKHKEPSVGTILKKDKNWNSVDAWIVDVTPERALSEGTQGRRI